MYFNPFSLRGCYYQDLNSIPSLVASKAQLIDLRETYDFQYSHIHGFINIPYRQLLTQLDKIDKQLPVYFLCETGKKSEAIATELCSRGYRAYSFIGGYLHYHQFEDKSLY